VAQVPGGVVVTGASCPVIVPEVELGRNDATGSGLMAEGAILGLVVDVGRARKVGKGFGFRQVVGRRA
jgi:hypothetical protein